MAETLTVDTEPNTEVLNADEQESLEIGENLEAEQEGLLAGKYKNAQELEKAYEELQKKFGSEENEQAPEAEAETEETEESAPEEDVTTDFLDRLWDEATENSVSEDTLQELSKLDPQDIAKMHLDYRKKNQQPQITDSQVKQLKDLAGGETGYKGMMDWAQSNLQKGEIDMYDKVMEGGDPLACYFAVQSLKYRFDDSSGVEGEMLTGKAPSNRSDQFRSQAQVVDAMNDPKYDNDPAYRREVMEKLERSDVKF